ncbi:hypothetical protein [Streptosporangium sp. NPDC000509]|uniref:hypothetical protein n=1 Tax=Streptosporangium sp. NPDC000509 TaxID=3366186 RepID=UPI0036CA8851
MRKSDVASDTDLTEEEGAPSARADVLLDHQKINVEIELVKLIRFKIDTETRTHTAPGMALTFMIVTATALMTGSTMGGLLWLASAPGWLIATVGLMAILLTAGGCLWWINRTTRLPCES